MIMDTETLADAARSFQCEMKAIRERKFSVVGRSGVMSNPKIKDIKIHNKI